MKGCPLYNEQSRFFSTITTCEATGEDLEEELELIETCCLADFHKCIRYRTYEDMRIEYLVRRKLEEEFGAG